MARQALAKLALTEAAVQVRTSRKSESAPIGAAKVGNSWRASGGE